MKNAYVVAVLGSGLLLAALGCNPAPVAVYKLDNSALPPAAKAMIAPDSKITSVHQAVYAKGGKDYVIDYVTADGSPKQIKYGDYHQSAPTGVFERFDKPEMQH